MSKLFFRSIGFITLVALAGCSDNKNAAYFEKHPDAIVPSAFACGKLTRTQVLKNKTCLAIAAVEKPECEQDMQNGMIMSPDANCDDAMYLIVRAVHQAQLQAYLDGKPDPVAAYMKKHPNY